MRHRFAAVGFIGLALFALGGCVATAQSAPARGVVVSGPPPAPLVEDRPQAPPPGTNGNAPNVQWVAGYWHWTGMQYAWIPGHWEAPPPGASWSAPRYTSADGAYFYEAGGWNGSAPQHTLQAPPAQQAPHANALR